MLYMRHGSNYNKVKKKRKESTVKQPFTRFAPAAGCDAFISIVCVVLC